ncbi:MULTISPECIES: hypothetical protein [Bacillus cereus group]|nr:MULTISPECIES: hypothetical protein [Bacillus cereus group]MEB9630818.1 hypothetical protein [Bacillus anthracis]
MKSTVFLMYKLFENRITKGIAYLFHNYNPLWNNLINKTLLQQNV